jgi:UDP-3-O-[3-hydroxymyristoyl] glucosamine N-acyltransferase
MVEMKQFFRINVNKYDKTKDFFLFRPSSISNPKPNSVMFVMEKYIEHIASLKNIRECLIFWPERFEVPKDISSKNVVVSSSCPRKDYNRFFKDNEITYYPPKEECENIDGAFISSKAVIGENSVIMPGAYIGGEVKIGKNSYIGCGTKIVGEALIGDNVIIRENVVIGADGLSTERGDDGEAITMPQFGGVIIENKVQIGANTVIARGAIDNTIIREGCKIDNCCFISHNVELEQNVFVVGETIMMGSSKAKKNSYISGNTVVRNKVTIEENAFIGMGAVVTKDVAAGKVVVGNPARER